MIMAQTLYNDPTFNKVAAQEINEKGCSVCTRSKEVFEDVHSCTVHKKFPQCKRQKCGFDLDMNENNN